MPADFIPYQIKHVQLEAEELHPNDLALGKGNYVVFWWMERPLGQFFLEPGNIPDDRVLLAKITEAIHEAVRHVIAKSERPHFNQSTIGSWNELQSSLFKVFGDPVLYSAGAVDLSVIICTRNRSQYIGDCLRSLLAMKILPKEIIVVDNAPSDASTRLAVEAFSGIIYCVEPKPGLDHARNKGIEAATCEFLAYVDDDVRVHPLWAHQVVQSFKDNEIGAMTGLVFAAELSSEAQMIFEKHWSFNRGFCEVVYSPGFIQGKRDKPPPVWEIGAGANMAFRRSVFKATGVFDGRLDAGAAGCSGDSEIWFRVLLKGYSIIYNPMAVVYHEHRRDMKGLKRQIFNYMRGFTTAALIQHKMSEENGYLRHLLTRMPYYYMRLAMRGFPRFRFRYKTLYQEVTGVAAGFVYYWKNRNRR